MPKYVSYDNEYYTTKENASPMRKLKEVRNERIEI